MVWLQANAEYAALAESIPTTGNVANFGCGEHQVFVAHQLRYSRRHFGRNAPLEGLQVGFGGLAVEDQFAKFADGQMADSLESGGIM